MSPAGFLELVMSLSLQVAVMFGVCGWLVRQSDDDHTGHRLWSTCHAMILVITLAAVCLPHLRLIPHSLLTDRLPLTVVAPAEHWLGGALLTAWALGAALYAIAIFVGIIDVRRILATAEPMHWSHDESDNGVTLLVSSRVNSPFCWQMQQPIVVLPEGAIDFPNDELCAIVRHELAHLRSGHPLALFLQRLVEMLYWFHPLVWWASRRAELNREYHCDRASNRDARETAIYLRSLLRLCELTPERRFGLPAGLSFHGNPSIIRLRVERLMQADHTHDKNGRQSGKRLGMLGLIGSALLTTCLWLPVNVAASSRSLRSPWPSWSASALYEVGIPARDYEIDGHRLRPHELTEQHSFRPVPSEAASTSEASSE
ncbi:MAG: M56 family metallopeptidase [Planctomycetaceae bacterium]|nr:M56 family metallopeptidase [Planctomycetaceae bacterium]